MVAGLSVMGEGREAASLLASAPSILTPEALALCLQLAPDDRWVEKHAQARRIPGAFKRGRKWLFRREDIERNILRTGQVLLPPPERPALDKAPAPMYPSVRQPMAPIARGNFPMGITQLAPRLFHIKARVVLPSADPTKKRIDNRKQERFEGTRSQAEERYLQIKAELRGVPLRRQARTFGDLLNLYEEMRGAIPYTQRPIFRGLQEDLGLMDLRLLEGALRQYQRLLRTMKSEKTGELLSTGTINRYRAMVAATLQVGVELKELRESPLTKSLCPKLKEIPRDRILTLEEHTRLCLVLERRAPYLLPLYLFAIRVPCRKSELVRMTRADLDLAGQAIRVRNGSTKNDEGTWKPIPPEQLAYFASVPADCPWLFYRYEAGQYLPLGDFKKAWRSALAEADIEDFRFHDTRHISATDMVSNGTPERVVMEVAGWKTNMLSTYWKNLGKKHLALVRFSSAGSVNSVATALPAPGKSGDFEAEGALK